MNLILPSIMQSIKPIHCENIAIGRKEYEVRKTKPNIPTPFKSYIYCTKNTYSGGVIKQPLYLSNNELFMKSKIGVYDFEIVNGKVIGEYICDDIVELEYDEFEECYMFKNCYCGYTLDEILSASCLSYDAFCKYGNRKPIYLWHIANLKIYDEPKELGDFSQLPKNYDKMDYYTLTHNTFRLRRPPQSWCYVKEAV